jgi:hypothetical protein
MLSMLVGVLKIPLSVKDSGIHVYLGDFIGAIRVP